MARLMDQRTTLMRDGIYDAAVAVLARDGLEAMTMEHVAEEAGVAKGSLYNYFQNKPDLIEFVHERTIAPLRQQTEDILDSEVTALEKLKAFIALCFRYMEERRGLFNFLFNEHAIHKFVREPKTKGSRYLATIIRQGIEEGVFRPVDPVFHGTLLFGATRQVLEEQLASEEPWGAENMTRVIVEFFLDGVNRP
jgi:AcrR family transcriptional regulator